MGDFHDKLGKIADAVESGHLYRLSDGTFSDHVGPERFPWLGRLVAWLQPGVHRDVDALEDLQKFLVDHNRDIVLAKDRGNLERIVIGSCQAGFKKGIRAVLVSYEIEGLIKSHEESFRKPWIALLTRIQSPQLRDGFPTDTACVLMSRHLQQLAGREDMPQQLLQEVAKGLAEGGRRMIAPEHGHISENVFLKALERDGSIQIPIGVEDHSMQLLVERGPAGYQVRLFNTGYGLEHHPKLDGRYQTYVGYEMDEGKLRTILGQLGSNATVAGVYELLGRHGTQLPAESDPLMFSREQLRGTCSWSVNLAVLRYLVMNQPGKSLEQCHQEWKLIKAALIGQIWQTRLATTPLDFLAQARVNKLNADFQLAQIADSGTDAFVHYPNLKGRDWGTTPRATRFNLLRQENRWYVGEWLNEFPTTVEFHDLPPELKPAKAVYDYHLAALEQLRKDVAQGWEPLTHRLDRATFPKAYQKAYELGLWDRQS